MASAGSFAPVVDLLFPPRCPLCGGGVATQGGICASCWSGLVIPGEPACVSCQRPLTDSAVSAGAICARCMQQPPRHAGIYAATIYNGASRDLVLALKYGRRTALAGLMARMIAARTGPLDGTWLCIPVPLHRWRLWKRGFNQAALIAWELAKQTGGTLLVDGLVRTRNTPALGGLGARQRLQTIRGSIAVRPSRQARLSGANVVLVDDVLTSGATTETAIRVLQKAGVHQVRIACFARVLEEAL